MSYTKFGPNRFSRFDVYWIQTDRQTDKLNLYIDCKKMIFLIPEVLDCACLFLPGRINDRPRQHIPFGSEERA